MDGDGGSPALGAPRPNLAHAPHGAELVASDGPRCRENLVAAVKAGHSGWGAGKQNITRANGEAVKDVTAKRFKIKNHVARVAALANFAIHFEFKFKVRDSGWKRHRL